MGEGGRGNQIDRISTEGGMSEEQNNLLLNQGRSNEEVFWRGLLMAEQ